MARRSSSGGRRRSSGFFAPARRPGPGFTLLEILAVLAIIGLISALLVGSGGEFLRSMAKDDAETVALNAIAGARHSAVLTGRPLELRFDEKARQLDWEEGQAALVGDGEVRLLPPERLGAILLGGAAVETPLARVRFYPDGTCDPFRLEIVRDRTSRIVAIDPWTCTALASESTPGNK